MSDIPLLPYWVYDLINKLKQYENDGHEVPECRIRQNSGYLPCESLTNIRMMCNEEALNLVPLKVREYAYSIAQYEREKYGN
jgi:hypothetical protein